MVQIGSVVLNVTDLGRAAAFWRSALGYVRRPGGHPGALVPPGGEGPALLLDETDMTHLDLHASSEPEQQAEVERLIALGAAKVNISTQLKKTYADGFKNYLEKNPTQYDPLKLIGAVQNDVTEMTKGFLKTFGSEGKA